MDQDLIDTFTDITVRSQPVLFTAENIQYFLMEYEKFGKPFPYVIKSFHDLYLEKGSKTIAEFAIDLITTISRCCGSSITLEYIQEQLLELFTSPRFDAIFIFDKKQLLKGTIIVADNQCKLRPNIFSVQLICSNENMLRSLHFSENQFGSVGSILLGVFLLLVKKNGMETAILEIAKSYLNVKAYCLYTKFGFRYNPELYGTLLKEKQPYISEKDKKKTI